MPNARRPAFQWPVYEISLKDDEGFPTVVVAGPDREHLWLYVHEVTPVVLRLHRWVVRFLLDVLRDLNTWFDQPRDQAPALVWTLPRRSSLSPECVLIATDERAWLHVFSATPSVVRLNERTVEFLLYALAVLPADRTDSGYRWAGRPMTIDAAVWLDYLSGVMP